MNRSFEWIDKIRLKDCVNFTALEKGVKTVGFLCKILLLCTGFIHLLLRAAEMRSTDVTGSKATSILMGLEAGPERSPLFQLRNERNNQLWNQYQSSYTTLYHPML